MRETSARCSRTAACPGKFSGGPEGQRARVRARVRVRARPAVRGQRQAGSGKRETLAAPRDPHTPSANRTRTRARTRARARWPSGPLRPKPPLRAVARLGKRKQSPSSSGHQAPGADRDAPASGGTGANAASERRPTAARPVTNRRQGRVAAPHPRNWSPGRSPYPWEGALW